MTTSDDDVSPARARQLIAAAAALENALAPTDKMMVWIYNGVGRDLNVKLFTSNDADDETLRVLRSAATHRRLRKTTGPERWFAREPGTEWSKKYLVSAAAVTPIGGHDRVRVWNRGGLSGELVVVLGDGESLVRALGLTEREGGEP